MSLTSSPSSRLITCPCHLNLTSLTFSAVSTTAHLLMSSFHKYLWPTLLHLFFLCVHTISVLLPSLSLQCLSPHIFWSLHFINISDQLSFISSYYVSMPSQFCFPHLLCTMSTTLHLLISSFHNVSVQVNRHLLYIADLRGWHLTSSESVPWYEKTVFIRDDEEISWKIIGSLTASCLCDRSVCCYTFQFDET